MTGRRGLLVAGVGVGWARLWRGVLVVLLACWSCLLAWSASPSVRVGASGVGEVGVGGANQWFVWADAGDSVFVRVEKAADFTGWSVLEPWVLRVVGPGGVTVAGPCSITDADPGGTVCSFDVPVSAAGVFEVRFGTEGSDQRLGDVFRWRVEARRGGVEVPGRVWADRHRLVDLGRSSTDVQLLTHDGYRYRVGLVDAWGLWSEMFFSETGPVSESCLPLYHSTYTGQLNGLPVWESCRNAKIFWEDPAPDIPAWVTLPDGTTDWVNSTPVDATNTGLVFERSGLLSNAGTVGFSVSSDSSTGTRRR